MRHNYPLELVQQILGHSEATASLHYSHMMKMSKVQVVEALESKLTERM